MSIIRSLREHAKGLERELYALYLAGRNPRTPWYAKAVAALVVGYAFSPIDLIPDFIPLLGYLDDLILLPLGIYLALRLIPDEVMDEAREQAREAAAAGKPMSRAAAVVIVALWLLLFVWAAWLVWPHVSAWRARRP